VALDDDWQSQWMGVRNEHVRTERLPSTVGQHCRLVKIAAPLHRFGQDRPTQMINWNERHLAVESRWRRAVTAQAAVRRGGAMNLRPAKVFG